MLLMYLLVWQVYENEVLELVESFVALSCNNVPANCTELFYSFLFKFFPYLRLSVVYTVTRYYMWKFQRCHLLLI